MTTTINIFFTPFYSIAQWSGVQYKLTGKYFGNNFSLNTYIIILIRVVWIYMESPLSDKTTVCHPFTGYPGSLWSEISKPVVNQTWQFIYKFWYTFNAGKKYMTNRSWWMNWTVTFSGACVSLLYCIER